MPRRRTSDDKLAVWHRHLLGLPAPTEQTVAVLC
jgi:hypothetical protein